MMRASPILAAQFAALLAASGCAAVRTTANATATAIGATADFVESEMTNDPSGTAVPPPDSYDRETRDGAARRGEYAGTARDPFTQPQPAPRYVAPMPAYQPADPAPPAASYPPLPPGPGGLRLHVARAGETMSTIAAQHGYAVEALERVNGIAPPYEVRPGDVVLLPNAPPAHAAATPRRDPPLPAASPTPSPPTAPPVVDTTAPVRPGTGFYARPVPGRIVAPFGAQANGRRLDGVEIAAREGEAIVAAADGEVVYAGGDLPAYDHLLLIRHADGGVTAYGYARRLLVNEGQRIRRGQPVAEAGGRGRVLFQARRGTTAIDPAPLLGD
ncbi:MAG: peptidoglycan DD-metalloendopeptidase family protein [Alphaproteobacteria bacterium]|nr:peptidoglycan DD-metalloendopeptidase family protein [Alphaproteobacteria bacterium]